MKKISYTFFIILVISTRISVADDVNESFDTKKPKEEHYECIKYITLNTSDDSPIKNIIHNSCDYDITVKSACLPDTSVDNPVFNGVYNFDSEVIVNVKVGKSSDTLEFLNYSCLDSEKTQIIVDCKIGRTPYFLDENASSYTCIDDTPSKGRN